MKRSHVIPLLVVIVALFAGALLSHTLLPSTSAKVSTNTSIINPPKPVPDFSLRQADGKAFTPATLQGHWSFLFFGYTSCPDVCPTTLAVLAQVDKALTDLPSQNRPQVFFVSVDAQRDTPEQLSKYVAYFDPAFTGITGSQPALEKFSLSLNAPVALTPQPTGGYTVDHYSGVFVVNPQGAVRAIFSSPHTAANIANDYRALLSAS